ncbi:MAG: hypothetical protein H6549_12585 [Chitinophagales bacterium]|nr:hypothetical protein [Chitinophagales bacterium]
MKKIPALTIITSTLILITIFLACSKGGGGTNPPPDPCSGVTVVVNGSAVNPTTTGGNNGSISATATGGSGITYSINGGTFQSSGNFTGLTAGTYTISAKTSSGCTGSKSFTLTDPANPCAGITINVTATTTNPSAPGASDGSITASATGSSGFTYSKDGTNFQASGTFSNLTAGSYTITAKDANGCTGSANFTLTDPNPCSGVTISVTGTTSNPSAPGASDGSITANATGSTGFTYSKDGTNFQASGTFSNLTAGSYTITAKDANGCTGSASFTLTDPNPCAGVTVAVTTNITNNTPCLTANGSVMAMATGGLAPYTFSKDGVNFQSSATFNSLAAGNYTITAKDANSCVGTTGAVVGNLPAGPLFSAVQSMMQTNCAPCHNNTIQNGGMNWTIDCNIVTFKDRIKARAVDANPSSMPPTGLLPLSERQKIIDWINAGGKFTD